MEDADWGVEKEFDEDKDVPNEDDDPADEELD